MNCSKSHRGNCCDHRSAEAPQPAGNEDAQAANDDAAEAAVCDSQPKAQLVELFRDADVAQLASEYPLEADIAIAHRTRSATVACSLQQSSTPPCRSICWALHALAPLNKRQCCLQVSSCTQRWRGHAACGRRQARAQPAAGAAGGRCGADRGRAAVPALQSTGPAIPRVQGELTIVSAGRPHWALQQLEPSRRKGCSSSTLTWQSGCGGSCYLWCVQREYWALMEELRTRHQQFCAAGGSALSSPDMSGKCTGVCRAFVCTYTSANMPL